MTEVDDFMSSSPLSSDEGSSDPFHPSNAQALNFIMQGRIYDVLLSLLTEANPTLAKDLLEMHAAGHLMGPGPAFSGKFITDEVNEDE